jgi:hypothetical protein
MRIVTPITIVLLSACTSTQITQTLSGLNKAASGEKPLTTIEVNDGLKEALVKGITSGANQASAVDGYFGNPRITIPFPPDVKKVEDKLRQVGLGKEVDKFVLTLNRGAEAAAKEAIPIFSDAIKAMTIDDAWAVLNGNEDAATQYLIRTTREPLRAKFKPVIQSALQTVNATKYYTDLINAYNKIPFVENVNPNLDDYATEKALDGLFLLVADEEKKIRQDPVARTTELLQRVFGYKK